MQAVWELPGFPEGLPRKPQSVVPSKDSSGPSVWQLYLTTGLFVDTQEPDFVSESGRWVLIVSLVAGVNSLCQSLSANPLTASSLTHLDLSGNALRGDDLSVSVPLVQPLERPFLEGCHHF